MTTLTTGFEIHPIPESVLAGVRASGDNGDATVEHLVAEGGEPLRCCLRNADPGERAILYSYELPLPPSPYRETGPVYVHAEPCAGPVSRTAYPAEWRGRPQVLRAYDRRGRIHEATRVHDGRDPEAAIAEVLAIPEVAYLHSRNVAYGCYMFAITRS